MRIPSILLFSFLSTALFAQTESKVWFSGSERQTNRNFVISEQNQQLIVECYTYHHSIFRLMDTLKYDTNTNSYIGKHFSFEKLADGNLGGTNSKSKIELKVLSAYDYVVNITRNSWYSWNKRDILRDSMERRVGRFSNFENYVWEQYSAMRNFQDLPIEVFYQKSDSMEAACLDKLDEIVTKKQNRVAEIQKMGSNFTAIYAKDVLVDFSDYEPDMRSVYWLAYNNPDIFLTAAYEVYRIFRVLDSLDKFPADLDKGALYEKLKHSSNHNSARRKLLRKLK